MVERLIRMAEWSARRFEKVAVAMTKDGLLGYAAFADRMARYERWRATRLAEILSGRDLPMPTYREWLDRHADGQAVQLQLFGEG